MNIIDWILYIPLVFCVCYLLLYAIASKFYRAPQYPEARTLRRIVVLFPAYKEDRVIVASIQSFLEQDYPKELYEIIVISDQMRPETNDALATLPIRLLMANYKESSKAKALAMAMDSIDTNAFDIVVIMDADNTTDPDFLSEINRAFQAGEKAIQAHRTAKNMNTDVAVLDAASEEINNSIFRSGHIALGFSSALIGSGMALEAQWFRQHVPQLETAGEDKELESLLLKQRIHIEYLEHVHVKDEKTQKKEVIKNQRKRWIAAQFDSLSRALPSFPGELLRGNINYCDKVFQWTLLPRIVLIFCTFFFTIIFTIVHPHMSIKWWILSFSLFLALFTAIPKRMLNKRLLQGILQLPSLLAGIVSNLFKLKGVNKQFIHTEHDH